MKYYYSLFLCFLLTSCQLQDSSSASAVDSSLSKWAEAYFNFDYKEAIEYMTPESAKWVRFAASNITEMDVEFIREHSDKTLIEITDRQMVEGDSVCNARIHVSNFVQLGTGANGNQVIDNADFIIRMVKRNGNWLVRTEGLPRSGRQSRD